MAQATGTRSCRSVVEDVLATMVPAPPSDVDPFATHARCTVISQITDRLVAERAAPRAASCATPHSGCSAQGGRYAQRPTSRPHRRGMRPSPFTPLTIGAHGCAANPDDPRCSRTRHRLSDHTGARQPGSTTLGWRGGCAVAIPVPTIAGWGGRPAPPVRLAHQLMPLPGYPARPRGRPAALQFEPGRVDLIDPGSGQIGTRLPVLTA